MPIIETHSLDPGAVSGPTLHQVYNGLDCCVTLEVHGVLQRTHNQPNPIYDFERALQAPALDMMRRGWKVNEAARQRAIAHLRSELGVLQAWLDKLADAVWGKPLNPRSPKQLQDFFYSTMRLPEVWTSKKGVRKLSMDREALEKLDMHFQAQPIIATIFVIRDLSKLLEMFEQEVSPEGRFHFSVNVAGTECISGDSIVYTSGGLRTIREIYEASRSYQIWNGLEFVTPARKIKYANRQGFRIEAEGGYSLKCSANHPVLTQRGWVCAEDLLQSDSLQLNVGLLATYGQHALPKPGVHILSSENLCEFVGMWLADGTLNCSKEHYRCRLSNGDPSVQNRFRTLSLSLFGLNPALYGEEMCFSSKTVCTWLQEIGLTVADGLGTAKIKTIPPLFLRGKPNLLRALLRGLTLDSHLTEKGIMYGTQSPVMQDQIQQILLTLGIRSVKLKTGDSMKLNIPRSYCGRFLQMIGFVQREKAFFLAGILNLRDQWHEPDNFGSKPFVPIKSIEPWCGDVYDLTMPESSPPQYVAQGMTVHNSGRFSTSASVFHYGGNIQNLTRDDDVAGWKPGERIPVSLRRMFESDYGYKLGGVDLEQAESREVGWLHGTLFDEWGYLDSCEAGDLHTTTCKLIWTRLPWPGDPKGDRALADQKFYRHFSYRDMSKRGGHGSSYMGTPFTMARHLKVPTKMMEDFQRAFFSAYPGFPLWHQWVAQQVQTEHMLVTPLGRQRHFFGRPEDPATIREAVAYSPQSSTADRMNLGMWRVWKHMHGRVELLAQVHDAIYFQFRDGEDEASILQEVLHHIQSIELRHKGRVFTVPGEAKTGWNWGAYHPKLNPGGLRKFKGSDDRKRPTLAEYI